MEGKFTHYLITRFNVPVKNWETDKVGQKVLDESWMVHRLDLFRQYCAPTIQHQTCTDFTWLIYCGLQTQEDSLDQIRMAISAIPHAEIRTVADFDWLLDDLRNLLSRVKSPFVITSRLDNDDGLGPEFISQVQQHFAPRHNLILNFTKGVLYDVHHKVLTEVRSSPRNHYGSLIEAITPDEKPLTVLGYPHGIPPAEADIINLPVRYSWLKIIHERNMASRTNGWPLFSNHIAKHFGLPRHLFPLSWPSTIWFAFRRFLSRVRKKYFTSSAV